MNKARRKSTRAAIDLLYQAKEIIENVRDEEQEALDNMPENLQMSSRADEMQEAIDTFDDAASNITDAIDYLEEIAS